jgi:hypothetical protein
VLAPKHVPARRSACEWRRRKEGRSVLCPERSPGWHRCFARVTQGPK